MAVAFVNTAAAREKNRQQGVASYAELLTWSLETGLLQPLDAERLSRRAAAEPQAEAEAWSQAETLRGALFRLFIALQTEKELPADDLRIFNQTLSAALPALRLVPGAQGPAWGWAGREDALDRMLWPVLLAAAELLISTGGRPQVRQCAMHGCRLFFVDRGPARRRRWCDPKTCGTRAKSLRAYRRRGKAARDKRFEKLGLWQTKRPRKSQIKL